MANVEEISFGRALWSRASLTTSQLVHFDLVSPLGRVERSQGAHGPGSDHDRLLRHAGLFGKLQEERRENPGGLVLDLDYTVSDINSFAPGVGRAKLSEAKISTRDYDFGRLCLLRSLFYPG